MNRLLELLSESNGQLSAVRVIGYMFAIMGVIKMGFSIFGEGNPLTWSDVTLISSALGWKTIQKKFENKNGS